MNVILLSGGSGKRLWPLSNGIRSKQFIKIFKKPDGTYESMIQRMYRMIKKIDSEAIITVATSKAQVSAIHNQLGKSVGISVEPCRKDTFAAIALVAAYLHDVKGVGPEESVIVCPADPYVDEDYFEALKTLYNQVQNSKAKLILMGIEPTYPSEKYGYILPKSTDKLADVLSFKEKPEVAVAKKYIAQGALWNGGVFAFKLKYVLECEQKLLGTMNYHSLFTRYSTLPKISFDYAVVEKEPSIQVMRFSGQWMDLGTWNTLTDAMDEKIIGKVVTDKSCNNVYVLNEMNVPVIAMGLKNVVISVSPDGILVSDMEKSSYIKPFVDDLDQQIMFAEKSWGNFRVLDIENDSMTIKVILNAGYHMNYHSHDYRDEVWIVIRGQGKVIVDSEEKLIKAGDVITVAAGCKHTVIANTELQIIEVQIGKEISVSDKHKYDLDFSEI